MHLPEAYACVILLSGVVLGHRYVPDTEYIGCYSEVEGRLMRGMHTNFLETLTPEICSKQCFSHGFDWSGTQNSHECFCSRTEPSNSKRAQEKDCNLQCDGDNKQTCGGDGRLSVYSTGFTDAISREYPKADYMGCYLEEPGNILKGMEFNFRHSLTPELCNKYCYDNGFKYAGAQLSSQCFCSRTRPLEGQKADENDCNHKCTGDEAKICGGLDRLSVYNTGFDYSNEVYPTPKYYGCYIEESTVSSKRLLQPIFSNFPETLTPEVCQKHCFDHGFNFAGTQLGFECFCSSNKPPRSKKTKTEECDYPCPGNEHKKCGGFHRLSLYYTSFYSSIKTDYTVHEQWRKPVGCYIERQGSTFQGLEVRLFKSLTPQLCCKICYENGFAYAGLLFPYQCQCLKAPMPQAQNTYLDKCNLKCEADKTQLCGGHDRLRLYKTGLKENTVKAYPEWKYVGCLAEVAGGLMKGLQTTFPTRMTTDVCNKHCFDNGFDYAGLHYGEECFCSRTRPMGDEEISDNECNVKCSGDRSQVCGGLNRLSVYETGFTKTFEKDYPIANLTGCYSDDPEERRFNGLQTNFPQSLTPEICIKHCYDNGFEFAGLQNGQECFCSRTSPIDEDKAEEEDCNYECSGDDSKICGGSKSLSVYQIGESGAPLKIYPRVKFIGCYEEIICSNCPKLRLETLLTEFPERLTPKVCQQHCFDHGFDYAGTQSSQSCLCSRNRPPYSWRKGNGSECNLNCDGDESQKCGGENYYVGIYSTGFSDTIRKDYGRSEYIGCYIELIGNKRLLQGTQSYFVNSLTPELCNKFCFDNGYSFSGAKAGNQCLCSRTKPQDDQKIPNAQCNVACEGDSSQKCGSKGSISVFSTGYKETAGKVATTTGNSLTDPSTDAKMPCEPSVTSVNGRQACRGELVFNEEFQDQKRLSDQWKHVVKVSEAPDFEFSMFHADPKNSFVLNGNLVIRPTIVKDESFITSGNLELKGCTGLPNTRECGYQAFTYTILPPVTSARLHTKDRFSFRYGTMEIRAKLPVGDWLVPELWLEPVSHRYGPHYASGRLRLASCLGNEMLICGGEEIGRSLMQSGVMMGRKHDDSYDDVRGKHVRSKLARDWHDAFHNYTLVWTPESISFKIDNEMQQHIVMKENTLCDTLGFESQQCQIWSSGSKIAPFDTDFYISLGLSAGNSRDFPDDCINRGKQKPWRNFQVKAMLKFWQDEQNWAATWDEEKSSLYVDYVRVTAL